MTNKTSMVIELEDKTLANVNVDSIVKVDNAIDQLGFIRYYITLKDGKTVYINKNTFDNIKKIKGEI